VSKSRDRKIRHIVEAVIAAFLFAFQYIPAAGPWYGLMIFPLATYIFSLFWAYPEFLGSEVHKLLFWRGLMFGRIVAIAGFVIFLIAFVQFLRSRGKLITTGLYSVVRHPQYFGITVMTLGISIMCMQYVMLRIEVLYIWLIQVLGYVLLAGYEERYLLEEYKREYQKYKQKVPLLFPAPCPTKIPEPLFSMGLALIIIFLCTFIVPPYFY